MTQLRFLPRACAASLLASLAIVALLPAGCGSSTNTGGALDAAAADGTNPGSNGCVQAGGTCGCGCTTGTKLAPAPLRDQCPQPCAQCGACSQQCCLPDPAEAGADAKGDAACTGSFACLCGTAYCDNGQWKCTSCASDAGGG